MYKTSVGFWPCNGDDVDDDSSRGGVWCSVVAA